MNYVRHQFEANYIGALRSNEFDLAINMLIGEIADFITTDSTSFAKMLSASGVKVESTDPAKLTKQFLGQLRSNSLLHALLIQRFIAQTKTNNPKAFAKKLSEGLNAIVGSRHNRTDSKDKDYYTELENKVKNYSKKIASADGSTSMEEPTTDKKEGGVIVITQKNAIKWLTIGLAVYGGWHLIQYIQGKIKENARRSLAAQGNGGTPMATVGQPAFVIPQPIPSAAPAAPVQPAPIAL